MFSKLFIAGMIVGLVGCSTIAGTVKGLGEDVKTGTDAVSNWVKPEQGTKK